MILPRYQLLPPEAKSNIAHQLLITIKHDTLLPLYELLPTNYWHYYALRIVRGILYTQASSPIKMEVLIVSHPIITVIPKLIPRNILLFYTHHTHHVLYTFAPWR